MSIVDQIADTNIKRASALGRLEGVIIGTLLYDDNLPEATFKVLFSGLERAYEALETENPDIEIIMERANQLGFKI